jgi:hypothetical protein
MKSKTSTGRIDYEKTDWTPTNFLLFTVPEDMYRIRFPLMHIYLSFIVLSHGHGLTIYEKKYKIDLNQEYFYYYIYYH